MAAGVTEKEENVEILDGVMFLLCIAAVPVIMSSCQSITCSCSHVHAIIPTES